MLADRRWSVADPITVSFEYSPVEHVRALEALLHDQFRGTSTDLQLRSALPLNNGR